MLLLIGQQFLLGDFQTLISPLDVDQRRGEVRKVITKRGIKRRPKKRIETPLELKKKSEKIAQAIEDWGAGVGFRR
jgi:hypothetical protein